MRRWLKTWLGQALNERFPSAILRASEPTVRAGLCVPGPLNTDRAHSARLRQQQNIITAAPTWWAECGSIKWVWTQDYFDNVFAYIERQRQTPSA